MSPAIARRSFLLGATAVVASGLGSSAASDAEEVRAAIDMRKEGIPSSFDDPMFADVHVRNSPIKLLKGLSLVDTSVELPRDDRTVLCLGDNSLRRCRVKSREAVRIAGGGTFTIDGCWLEAIGIGNDHADCIQCYSPGARGTLHIRNTTIRAYRTSDVTPPQMGSQGLFVGDNWTGLQTIRA